MNTLNIDEVLNSLIRNDQVLSRTQATGVIDTSVSALKAASRHEPTRTKQIVQENRFTVARFIARSSPASVASADDLHASILTLATLTNLNLTEPEQGLYRSWELDPTRKFGPPEDSAAIAPCKVAEELRAFAAEICTLVREDTLVAAALLEWGIGIGPLHPFADACGRIGRSASALLLLQSNARIRMHADRATYFKVGGAGTRAFVEYYRDLPTASATSSLC